MSDGWAWARSTREAAIAAPIAGSFRIETVADDPAYWAAWETAFGRDGFPPEMYFARGVEWQRRAERLADARGGEALVDRWLVCDGERVAAVYRGEQLDGYTYMTGHAAVHLDYRRRGIYRAVIERVLETTRELGFTSVVRTTRPATTRRSSRSSRSGSASTASSSTRSTARRSGCATSTIPTSWRPTSSAAASPRSPPNCSRAATARGDGWSSSSPNDARRSRRSPPTARVRRATDAA